MLLEPRELRRLRQLAANERAEPLLRLRAANMLATDWEEKIRRLVLEAREAGATWDEVGRALTISKQAARARFWGLETRKTRH